MNQFLMAQTVYIRSLVAISQADTAIHNTIHHIIMTHHGMKKGIKVFGELEVRSIYKEIK